MDKEVEGWEDVVASAVPEVAELLGQDPEGRERLGFSWTLEEILQQPLLWLDSAQRAHAAAGEMRELLRGTADDPVRGVMLTGSGSSLYAGECVAPGLQKRLGIPARAVAAGDLLSHPGHSRLPGSPGLLVSFARSGNSPESAAVVDRMLSSDPRCRHLFVTCNREGRLATAYRGEPRARALVLHERTNDRSLVMTSSFTSMVLAGSLLASLDEPAAYLDRVGRIAGAAREILVKYTGAIARAARGGNRFAVYLGDAGGFGAARESALKMLEMTAGRIRTMPETFLGLRHGPMSAVHSDTLVVGFLPTGEPARSYGLDLLRELKNKGLGSRTLVVGHGIPREVLRDDDIAVDCAAAAELSDDDWPVLDVLVGQLLGFFSCLAAGLRPDAPSPGGVITRVVGSFTLYP